MSEQTVLRITNGCTVIHQDREFTVLRLVDLTKVMAREKSSGEKVLLSMGDVTVPARRIGKKPVDDDGYDLLSVPKEDWDTAEARLKVLEPLLAKRSSRADYEAVALNAGCSVASLYRWASAYGRSRRLSSLLPIRRPGGRGKSRLMGEVEAIIDDQLENYFLTEQQISNAEAIVEIQRLCSNAKLPIPSERTIWRRIDKIALRDQVKKRQGVKAAREQFDKHKGSVPDTQWPLSMVMMDHTELPVIIVDDVHRKPIDRPWITLAIDVYSRVCLGMYLTLDSPSSTSAGCCLAHAMLPKEKWLRRLGLGDIEWPFYGDIRVLHMDNAKEFRGDMLERACMEYGIDAHFRPAGQPHFGAHIERLMGTVSQQLKSVKGATFSGPKEKGEYDAEAKACLTLDELEKWLVLFFAQYHRQVHGGIHTTPLAKWREGILGTKTTDGCGLPIRRLDEEKVTLDFLPCIERTIQQYGVLWDVEYWHDCLRPWIGALDPNDPARKAKRKFLFRRDPRDISQIYFFDPDLKRYFAIPSHDTSLAPVAVWEWRGAKSALKAEGVKKSNKNEVFSLITRRKEIESDSSEKTKSARNKSQKRAQNEKVRKERTYAMPTSSNPAPTGAPAVLRNYNPEEVEALDDDY